VEVHSLQRDWNTILEEVDITHYSDSQFKIQLNMFFITRNKNFIIVLVALILTMRFGTTTTISMEILTRKNVTRYLNIIHPLSPTKVMPKKMKRNIHERQKVESGTKYKN
jgi:membrane protein CcdC involved in cytochrome C biogenesis